MEAVKSDKEMIETGFVKIGDKWYKKVSSRVADFRNEHGDFTIKTNVEYTDKTVRATTEILDAAGRLISNGHSEKKWRNGDAGQSLGVERVETAAVGRALAFFGLPGDSIGSADEVIDAVEDQTVALTKQLDGLKRMVSAIDANWGSVIAIRETMAAEDWDALAEVYDELDDQSKTALWVAPSKGGLFSTEERRILKEGEGLRSAREQRKQQLRGHKE